MFHHTGVCRGQEASRLARRSYQAGLYVSECCAFITKFSMAFLHLKFKVNLTGTCCYHVPYLFIISELILLFIFNRDISAESKL